ncbi:hypothetical protein NFI96_013047 [Prochilodus magdalenae]|nr:hypothetical protein NFI96_013047 [Prochilodus magdalenae]
MTVSDYVNQTFGEDAIIPCTFTTPYTDYQDNITVIWRTKEQIIFRCLSKGSSPESGQNCTQSTGRYSLSGNPRKNNISLRIVRVSFLDGDFVYFCRVELSKKADSYETPNGTRLDIRAVPEALESIYIRTLPSGQQFITCDVKGTPPPKVTWTNPENMNSSLVSVQSSLARASSSIPANLPNTNYTCQIQGKNGLQDLSIYYSRAQQQQQQNPYFIFSIVFMILSAVCFTLFVLSLVVLCKKGKEQTHHFFTVAFKATPLKASIMY